MKVFSKSFLIGILISSALFSCKKASDPEPDISSEGITTWTSSNLPTTDTLSDVFATSLTTVYATGLSSTFYKSNDGGVTWNQIDATHGGYRYGLCFTDANTGYISGGNSYPARVWKTTDAGATWEGEAMPVASYSHYTAYDICFPTKSTGYSVGESGETYKTTDAGANWTLNVTGTSDYLCSIFFNEVNTGYAGGWGNALLKTTNGGTTWTTLTTGLPSTFQSRIQSIYFLNAATGYISGGDPYNTNANSFIMKTTDGGSTWTNLVHPATQNNLSDIYFTDANIGYCIGGSVSANTSTILKTTDGGSNWTEQPSSAHCLNKMHFVDDMHAYCVGYSGTVLKGN